MITAIAGVFLALFAIDAESSVIWNQSYSRSLESAKQLDKPLFILFERGSTPLAKMTSERPFLSVEVEAILTQDYVRLFVDAESEVGKRLADQFGAFDLPRFVVIDRSGEWQVYKRSGVHSASELAQALGRYRRTKLTNSSTTQTVSETANGSGWSPALCKT